MGDLPHMTDDHARVSLDLRCYNKVPVPFPFNSDWEFYAALYPKLAIYEELAIECIARMFNYSSRWEFLEMIFPGHKLDNVMGSVGSVILQHAAGGRWSLLSEEALPGMRKHFARLQQARAQGGNVNYEAFQRCYKEFEVEFEDPSRVDVSAHFSARETFVRSLKYNFFKITVKLGGGIHGGAWWLGFVLLCLTAFTVLLIILGLFTFFGPHSQKKKQA